MASAAAYALAGVLFVSIGFPAFLDAAQRDMHVVQFVAGVIFLIGAGSVLIQRSHEKTIVKLLELTQIKTERIDQDKGTAQPTSPGDVATRAAPDK